jgi:anti-anti-sigma factor
MADEQLMGTRARTVVWVDGEHDVATAPSLTNTLDSAIADSVVDGVVDGAADVVVDMSGVTFMGAATVDVLIRFRSSLRDDDRVLTVRSPSRCAVRVLDACGLTELIEPG